jgi:hypothetical protein
MINFLLSKKEAAADGATFRPAVWNALVSDMALHHTTGAMKTASACKSKYSRVCSTVYSVRDSLSFLLILSSFDLPTTSSRL